jgi:hypothetical protein
MALSQLLRLNRCPHCRVSNPTLTAVFQLNTRDLDGRSSRDWSFYKCSTCGGIVTAWSYETSGLANPNQWFPGEKQLEESIPNKARTYLDQAISSIHAPAGAVMLAASSVDAMLKIKRCTEGTLYSRIEEAAAKHLITPEMAAWAHEIRLDANDQRHADEDAPLPEVSDAEKVIAFATALAEFLFVLPARVQRGRAKPETTCQDDARDA